MPRVSTILAVHNGEAHLETALNSLIAQTYADVEYILVDDGSTDSTLIILDGYRERDSRFHVLRQPQKSGLASSLNLALRHAQGDYVARMDADDECLPERIARQVEFMDAHPDVGVCGTWIQWIDSSTVWRYPVDDASIRVWLLFQPMLCHPSVMLRRSILDAHHLKYDESFRYAQDYDLWLRLMPLTQFANVGEVLLRYRIHAGQVSKMHRPEQDEAMRRAHQAVLSAYVVAADASERDIHYKLATFYESFDPALLPEAEAWLLKLRAIDAGAYGLAPHALDEVIGQKWHEVHYNAASFSLGQWLHYLKSPLTARGHYRRKLGLLKKVLR